MYAPAKAMVMAAAAAMAMAMAMVMATAMAAMVKATASSIDTGTARAHIVTAVITLSCADMKDSRQIHCNNAQAPIAVNIMDECAQPTCTTARTAIHDRTYPFATVTAGPIFQIEQQIFLLRACQLIAAKLVVPERLRPMGLAGTRPPLVHHCLVVIADGCTSPSQLTAPRQRLLACRRILHGEVHTIAHRHFDYSHVHTIEQVWQRMSPSIDTTVHGHEPRRLPCPPLAWHQLLQP